MNETTHITLRRILAFSSIVEFATGLALMATPVLVVELLVGAPVSGAGVAVGRCMGIALVALGLACWPGRPRIDEEPHTALAMLVYNALIALYLGYLGVVGHAVGVLLWPVVALHGAVALALVWARRAERLDGGAGASPQ
jgi:hypothetical protein